MSHPIDRYEPWFDAYQDLKHQMIDMLSDADLSHVIQGSPSLGELCLEHGEVEQSYLDSFRKHELTFEYSHADREVAGSTEALRGWYAKLDGEFRTVLDALTERDLETVTISRGTWLVSIRDNLAIYKEAAVIFAAKSWVHLLAMGKTLPKQWRDWI